MPGHRQDRINEEVKRELSALLREIKDPRIPSLASVVKVSVTSDLRHAKAYVSCFGEYDEKQALAGLESASGFLRRAVGERVNLRYTPELHFIIDNSIEYGSKINKMINDLHLESDAPDTQNPPNQKEVQDT